MVCLLDNRVVGGQIGVIGWGGETRLDDGRIRGMQDARPDPKIFLTPRFSSSRDAECGITRNHQPNDRAFARDQVLSGRLEHLAGREEDVRRRQNSRDRTKRSAPEFLEPVPTSQRFSPSGSPKFGPLYPLCSQFAYEMPFFALIQIRRPLSHRIDRIIAQ